MQTGCGKSRKWHAHNARLPSDCNALTIYRFYFETLLQLAGQPVRLRRGSQQGPILHRQGREVFMLRRVVEQASEWQMYDCATCNLSPLPIARLERHGVVSTLASDHVLPLHHQANPNHLRSHHSV